VIVRPEHLASHLFGTTPRRHDKMKTTWRCPCTTQGKDSSAYYSQYIRQTYANTLGIKKHWGTPNNRKIYVIVHVTRIPRCHTGHHHHHTGPVTHPGHHSCKHKARKDIRKHVTTIKANITPACRMIQHVKSSKQAPWAIVSTDWLLQPLDHWCA
jgi:hypothetical protein